MEITEKSFGRLANGREATLITARHENGVSASFTNYGASLVGLVVPDRAGGLADLDPEAGVGGVGDQRDRRAAALRDTYLSESLGG